MTDTKKRERERLDPKAIEEMREWLSTMPLSNKNPDKNLRYLADFVAVAAHLELPQNSRVLELGAGSCWPSEWLYRMGYRTVSTDISLDMLRLGQKRFQPLRRERDNYALHAHFVCSDAEDLPFGDGVFEAVIVFNALHHFPRLPAALEEIQRVLSPSGRLIFAEPGEGHSESDEARREMAEHGVLERDIVIDEAGRLAEKAGFAETAIILNRYPDTLIPYRDWGRFSRPYRGWRYKARLVDDLVQRQRRHPCLVMRKGADRPLDSRRPGLLRATLTLEDISAPIMAGHPFRLRMVAVNRGDTLWISQGTFLSAGSMNTGEGGYVNLGVKLLSGEGELRDDNFGRGPFRRDVPPGGSADVAAILRAPPEPGDYRLKIDLVDEGFAWFEDCGSNTMEVPFSVVPADQPPLFDSRFPDRLEARITLSPQRLEASPGETLRVSAACENTGNTVWLAQAPLDDPPSFGGGYVRLGWQLRNDKDRLLDLNYGRAVLPGEIGPGEGAEIRAQITAPGEGGRYHVHFDLVDEQVAWFADRGSSPAVLILDVRGRGAEHIVDNDRRI